MIVAFAVEPAVFQPGEVDRGQWVAAHRRLLALWRRFGVFVHPGRTIADDPLLKALSELRDQEVRKLWAEALKTAWHRTAPEVDEVTKATRPERLHRLRDALDLVCFVREHARRLGLPEDRPSLRLAADAPEVCRFDCVDQAEAFRRAAELADLPVPAGTPVDDVWEERLAPLVAASETVTVIDRYCLKAIGGDVRSMAGTGFGYLLRGIGRDTRPHSIEVFAATPRDRSPGDVRDALRRTLPRLLDGFGGVRAVNLFLHPDESRFGRIVHGRFLVFGPRAVFLDIGLEVLEGQTVRRTCEFKLEETGRTGAKDLPRLRQKCQRMSVFECS